jgi:WS/DGAT/MGAT family acyltransferase
MQWMEGFTSSYLDVWKRMIDAQTGFLNLGPTLSNVQKATEGLPEMAKLMPELTMPLERYAINKPCSGNRKIVWSEHSFTEARQIRGALGGTVNDVVLTVLAGGMSRFLRGKGQNVTGKNLRVMVPVSLRKEDKKGALGNLVSALPALLPLDISDPLERFKVVRERMDFMKNARLADALSLMGSFAGAAPPMLQAFVGALPYTSIAPPPFHMVCTNVPGPQIPLYACGREMVTYYPHVPPGNDLGVNMAIQSYNQKLFFGLTSDRAAVPDPGALRDFLVESFAELRKASGIEKDEAPAPSAKKPRGRRAPKTESAAAV